MRIIDTETWSYTILGNNTATEIYGALHDIVLSFLSDNRLLKLDVILKDSKYIRTIIEENYDIFVSYVFKTGSRLGFQALGVFLMRYGAIITENLKNLILKHSNWSVERKQLYDKNDRSERKKCLFDFREKIMKYNNEKKLRIIDETVTDVIEKKKGWVLKTTYLGVKL